MSFVMKAPNKIPDILYIKYPCFVQPKLNGYRGIYVPDEGFYGKNGNLLKNNTLLQEYFSNILNVSNCVIEGQFCLNTHTPKDLHNCLHKKDYKINKCLKFIVFDCLSLTDWTRKKCSETYEQRLKMLRIQLNDRICDYDKIIDMPNDIIENSSEIMQVYKSYLKKGYEGCIIRNIDAGYKWKRVSLEDGSILKLQPYQTAFLQITEIYEGENELQDTLGGIVVDNNCHAVRISTGFTLEERSKIWSEKDTYIGKFAEIKFLSTDKEGNLQDPKFIKLKV